MKTCQRIESIEHQIKSLRIHNRFLLIVTVFTLGILVFCGCFDSKPAIAKEPADHVVKIVKANNFMLLDEKGRCRARLHMNKDKKGPSLTPYDEDAKQRASLCA